MRQKTALVIAFASTAHAMREEAFCAANGLPGRLIPVPREITAGCGLAFRTSPEEETRFKHVFAAEGIEYEGMHTVELWG
ncbi:MAG: DUF3343 domain-containing protein [Clostridiales bacterium]|nr:DUF3343 domain-containing protein [Clostridiales bacterium]